MPRGPETIYINMSLNGRHSRVQEAARQAASCQMTLGTYLKRLVLAVLEQGSLLLLPFREQSHVLARLQAEAEQLEMPLDAYVLALLADRDRNLYSPQARPSSLWFPRGHGGARKDDEEGNETGEQELDNVDMEAAMQNVDAFLENMPDMAGF